jgi:hypothetical protein
MIGEHDTAVVMHNDGVVQGLSEVPFMEQFKRWGILTIGTGLGNARFTHRDRAKEAKEAKAGNGKGDKDKSEKDDKGKSKDKD